MKDYTIEQFKTDLEKSGKIPVFEFPVIEIAEHKDNWITFNISIDTMNKCLIAQHVALTREEDDSEMVAFKSVAFDDSRSLDEHLQELYSICYSAINISDFFIHKNEYP